MAIVVPSRFSLLKIVEDDYLPPKPKENTKTKKVEQKNKKVDDKKVKNPKPKVCCVWMLVFCIGFVYDGW